MHSCRVAIFAVGVPRSCERKYPRKFAPRGTRGVPYQARVKEIIVCVFWNINRYPPLRTYLLKRRIITANLCSRIYISSIQIESVFPPLFRLQERASFDAFIRRFYLKAAHPKEACSIYASQYEGAARRGRFRRRHHLCGVVCWDVRYSLPFVHVYRLHSFILYLLLLLLLYRL